MASSLAGKWVLITGASSGFGAAAAIAFGREGSNLVLGARREDRLVQVSEQARASGAGEVIWQGLDVASVDSVHRFGARVRATTPVLDVLVNNAGGALGLDPVATGRDEDWEAMMQSNVLGVLRITREFLPLLLPNPGSLVLNVGSVAGRVAYEGGAAYCAAKAGELQITRALRLELCGTGVRVATLDPGLAETEFSRVRFKGDEERARNVYSGTVPLSAADVAEAMVWMASRPAHVTIDEMVIKCTDQAAIHKVHRRPALPGGQSPAAR